MMTTRRDTSRPARIGIQLLNICLGIVLVGAMCWPAPAAEQRGIDERLLGEWIGTSGEFEGAKATISRDSIVLSGERLPLRFVSPGVLLMGPPDDADRLRYQLAGETLTVVSDGETSTWRRVGGTPKPTETTVEKTKARDDSSGSQDATKKAEPTNATARATIFKEHKLTDPGMNNQVAFTYLIPETWSAEGELKRMPPGLYSIPVMVDIKFTAPDGRQVHFFPSLVFDFDNAQPGQKMQPTLKGNLNLPLPPTPGTWLLDMARSSPDSGIANLKLASEEDVPEVTRSLRQQNQQFIQQVEQGNQFAAQSGVVSRYDTQATRVVLTYDRDGRSYEESVLIMWNYLVTAWQGRVTSGLWSIPTMFSLRGPAGTDYRNDPELIAVLGSVRTDPAWQAEMNKYWAQLAQIRHKGNMDRLNASAAAHQERMNTLNETSDLLMSGWKSRNASQDRMQERTIDTIHEQTPYTTPAGETVKLPSFYSHVYTDGNGRYILNNDSRYEPNTDPAVNQRTWQRIEAKN